MIYSDYLKTNDWKQKRKLKHSRKKLHCSICYSKYNLETHHLDYRNLVDVRQSDLRILCKTCHEITHKLMNERKIVFKRDSHHSKFAIIKTAVKKYRNISVKQLASCVFNKCP